MKRNTLVGPQLQEGNRMSALDLKRAWWLLVPLICGVLFWIFTQAFAIAALAMFVCFFVLVLALGFNRAPHANLFLYGSARWADKADITAAGLLDNDGVYVGAWTDKNDRTHYLRHAGPEHILCYAPTRSGKGVGLIVPTLLSWPESVFVTDLKGELYELTAGWRQQCAYNRVLRFEPAAASGSCCFNPIDELRIGTEHEVGDVQNLALLMVDPEGKGLQPGNHWQRTAHSLIVGCLLHLCYRAKVEGSSATFASLDQMLSDPSRSIEELWMEMLGYVHLNGATHPVVSACARDMIDRPKNEAGSVVSTTKGYIDLFRDPTIAQNTSGSDFRIRDLMHDTHPVSLYIVTQPNDKARVRPLVRIVVNMIVRLLADKLEFENGQPKPIYKHRLLAMIDEFPALGKLEILQESLAFVAGYGIKCYLISQDINQLKSKETGYGPDETITSNCHIQTAFAPNRLETAEHLSKLTGQTTIIKEQFTRSGRGWGTQTSRSIQEVQRPLLTPDEAMRMRGPKKDARGLITAPGDMVVYCAGCPAIYGRQPLYFQDPTFAARAAVPPPMRNVALFRNSESIC
jgi:type IV secretion system protein VirD4